MGGCIFDWVVLGKELRSLGRESYGKRWNDTACREAEGSQMSSTLSLVIARALGQAG